MVVGEPALMGGEFGDEDERLITRLENTQYEPNGENEDTAASGGDQSQSSNQFQQSPSLQAGAWQDKKPSQATSTAPDDIKTE